MYVHKNIKEFSPVLCQKKMISKSKKTKNKNIEPNVKLTRRLQMMIKMESKEIKNLKKFNRSFTTLSKHI